jgi:hypothetical protein
MVADLEHCISPNTTQDKIHSIQQQNCSPLMEIKMLPTHVHSTDGCKFGASAQHATQVLFIVTSEFSVFPLSLGHFD